MNTPILNKLKELPKKNLLPLHMPGHKRKYGDIFQQIGQYDITEINGYDNLHNPEGIIQESMEELSKVYQTVKSWYLVNGSTSGIHAAVASVCRPGDNIVIARNCHKAVYHIIELLQLHVHYLMPDMIEEYNIPLGIDGSCYNSLEEMIEEYDIKAVLITSPTYEGIMAEVEMLHHILKSKNIPLIVDEAHGAHLKFHPYFPKSAVESGADLVIQSSHKTLPALTQTAMLHLCSDLIDPDKIQKILSYFESSSPSYILLSSIEYGVHYMENNKDKIQQYVDNLRDLYTICGQLKNITILNEEILPGISRDPSKIVILIHQKSWNGKQLAQHLYEKYQIELEMSEVSYCIAMTSVMDKKEDFEKLKNALLDIDLEISEEYKENTDQFSYYRIPEKEMESWECDSMEKKVISLKDSVGEISASYVHLYPPGIPILVPGEKILKETVENINYYLYNGYCVTGVADKAISVIKRG